MHRNTPPQRPLLMYRLWACCCTSCLQWSSTPPALQSEPFQSPKGRLDLFRGITASLSSSGAQFWAHVTPPGRHKPCSSCLKCWTPTPLLLPLLPSVRQEPTFIDKQFLLQIFQMAFPPPSVCTHSHRKEWNRSPRKSLDKGDTVWLPNIGVLFKVPGRENEINGQRWMAAIHSNHNTQQK